MSDFNARMIEEFRANGGRVAELGELVLVHTIGRKTGTERVNPMVFMRDGDRIVVFASKAGHPTNPDWFENLMAHPRVTIELGTETFEVTARVAEGDERERLWSRHKQQTPRFAEYEKKTPRQIPVVILERV